MAGLIVARKDRLALACQGHIDAECGIVGPTDVSKLSNETDVGMISRVSSGGGNTLGVGDDESSRDGYTLVG